MTKKGKGNPEPPIVLRDVLAGKPELTVHAGDLTVTARVLAKWLAEKCESLFRHNGKPALVIPADDDGIPTIRPSGCNEIIIEAHKLCQPFKYSVNQNKWLEATLPDKVAELYLAMPDEWRLRPLAGITTGPILRADGSIRTAHGYDPETRCLCCCNLTLAVPDTPSIDDAKRALKTLRRAFRTHAFADRITVPETFSIDGRTIKNDVVDLEQPPGKDESTYLVALLTAVARASLPLAPGFAWTAPDTSGSGAGKDLLVKAISTIAFGNSEPRAVPPRTGKEELDKTITAELLRGEPFVYLQNFNGLTLQSPVLCVALTERHAELRILGKSEMGENATAFIAITGTALIIGQDLVRRMLKIDIDARCEHPELREFAGDFLADIRHQRAELLTAALTIWRYGRQTKLTRTGAKPLGGFEQWAAWVRDPLLALACADPVARITELKASDPYRQETAEIFQAWWEHHRDDWVTANGLNEAVKESIEPDSKKRNRQTIAARVAKLVGTRIAGFHLTSDKDDKGHWTPTRYQLKQVGEESGQASDVTPASEVRTDGRNQQDISLAALSTVLAAWKKAIGVGERRSLARVIEMAAGPLNPSLYVAFLAVAAMDDGKTISNVLLSRWLRACNEVPVDGLQLSYGGVDKTGSPLWTLQSLPSKPSSEEGDADDWQFNREPDDAAVRPEPAAPEASPDATTGPVVDVPDLGPDLLDEHGGLQTATGGSLGPAFIPPSQKEELKRRGFTDEEIYEMLPDRARKILDGLEAHDILDDQKRAFEEARQELEEEPPGTPPEPEPLPSDSVARWRVGFARLDPARDPCAGFRAGDWARTYNVVRTFLAGPFAKHAADHGWTDRDLFGVHPVVGVARPDCCGVLMTNGRGAPVTRVTPMFFQFGNLLGRKTNLNVGGSVPVWDWKAKEDVR